MIYTAVIFDLFGTLAEFSALAHDRVLGAMATALNMPPEDFKPVWSTTYLAQEQGTLAMLEAVLRQICLQIGGAETDASVEMAGRLYRDFQRNTLTPRPEALPMLTTLRQS